jgi:probable metal-binding protein
MTEISTNQVFHVHDIMDQLALEQKPLELSQLVSLINNKFGEEARYNSCSVEGMNAKFAIEFLIMRKKLTEPEPGKYLASAHAHCNH